MGANELMGKAVSKSQPAPTVLIRSAVIEPVVLERGYLGCPAIVSKPSSLDDTLKYGNLRCPEGFGALLDGLPRSLE